MSDVLGVTTPDGSMPAHLFLPPAGSGPGLVLLQEIFGVSGYVRRRAADLAEAGYVVVVPELYWRVGVAAVEETAPDLLGRAMALVQLLDWETTVADAVAALAAVRSLPETTAGAGVLGFCFGGGVAFSVAATADPDVLVSYYGSAIPTLVDLAPEVTCPSLHHVGEADSYLDAASVARVREAVTGTGAETRFETYPGADHAFDNPDFPLHHPEASRRAWATTLEFLDRHLPRA